MVKQAYELEMAGMFKEAADLYYKAAVNKPQRIEYRTALRRAGMMHTESVSQAITDAYRQGQYETVVYDYRTLTSFTSRLNNLGANIRIDNSVVNMYNTARENYLTERYDQGLNLLGQGRYDEAKVVFERISDIQPDFRDTRTYLNTATLEPIFQRGNALFGQGNYMQAYNEWRIVSQTDPNYKDVRSRMQQALTERYQQGSVFLMNEDFSAAAEALGEVYMAEPGFMDVRTLFIEARAEPVYRRATQNLEAGRCRTAYFEFSEILSYAAGNYKESRTLAQQALECGRFPIAIQTRNMPAHASDGPEFEKSVIQAVLDMEDPFIRIHSLPSLDTRLSRTFTSGRANPDRRQLRDLSDNHSIQAVLMINFPEYVRDRGTPERTERTGFERIQIENDEGEITFRDRRVTYTEISQTNRASLHVTVQLVSTRNGEVLLTRRFQQSEQSSVHYAAFRGDVDNLYPAMLRDNTWIIDERGRNSLKRLLSADREIVSEITLRDKIFRNLSERIAEAIVSFNPEN